ncbi:MAG: hypothetical protein A2Y33_15730 [Spirochaetes bacterium GWF1_51_8]|nr:MAG: hypothetical protein A2Y33_15730 [Spirochaetes bacterium GWF1_51_8]
MYRNRFRGGLLLAAIVFILASCGGTPLKPSMQGRLFFWKAQGVSNTVYLLGSIHLADSSIYPLDPVIESALSNSDYVVVELDVDKAKSKINMLVAKEGMYHFPFTNSLKNDLPPELYDKVVAYGKKFGMNASTLNIMKPWFAAFTFSGMNMINMGYTGENGLESYVLGKVRSIKPILELESAEFQIRIFSKMSLENQTAFLISQMLPADELKREFENLYASWKSGNIEQFTASVLGGKEQWDGEVNKVLIYDRNITMADKIAGYLNGGGTYFVLVGAAHFVGYKGIISLLENAGYKVIRY